MQSLHFYGVYATVSAVIHMKQQLKGTLYLLLATVIWGSTFVAQSVSMDHMGPFTFQAARCLLGAIVLLPVIWFADRKKTDGRSFWERWTDKQLWKGGLLCGVPLFLACNLQQMGLTETDAGKSAFLTAMYIVIVPLIGIFLKKKPSKMIYVSVLLAVGGLYCLSCVGVTSVSLGDLLLIGCALMFAVQIVCVDRFAGSTDPLRLNAIQALVSAVLSAVVMFVTEEPEWPVLVRCWLPIGYAGVLSMGVAYTLQIVGQRLLPPAPASLIMSLESVFAVLCGCLILQETLTAWETAGCVLMFAAVVLSQIPNKKKEALI